MTRFEWDGLVPGDLLHVHHPFGTVEPARPGVVATLEVRGRRGNVVAVRLLDGDHEVVHPGWLSSHRSFDAGEDCWRCVALSATARVE